MEASGVQNSNLVPLEQFISVIGQITDDALFLESHQVAQGAGYDVGSFSIPQINGVLQPLQALLTSEGSSLSSFVSSLSGDAATALNSLGNESGLSMLSGLFNSSSIFSFPVLTNPQSALGLLLGNDVNLFEATLPPLSLTFGPGFDAAGNPLGAPTVLASVPIIPGNVLNATLSGDFQAALNLAFGFDTSGLTEYANGGFSNPSDILNGLYITDNINGVIKPFASVTALIELGFNALGGVAGGGVNLEGNLNLNLNDTLNGSPADNKLYLDEVEKALETNPFELFTTSGGLSIGGEFHTILLPGGPWNTPRHIILDFSSAATGSGVATDGSGPSQHVGATTPASPPAPPPPANLASLSNGVLTLNIGPLAGDRNTSNNSDGDENYQIAADELRAFSSPTPIRRER